MTKVLFTFYDIQKLGWRTSKKSLQIKEAISANYKFAWCHFGSDWNPYGTVSVTSQGFHKQYMVRTMLQFDFEIKAKFRPVISSTSLSSENPNFNEETIGSQGSTDLSLSISCSLYLCLCWCSLTPTVWQALGMHKQAQVQENKYVEGGTRGFLLGIPRQGRTQNIYTHGPSFKQIT